MEYSATFPVGARVRRWVGDLADRLAPWAVALTVFGFALGSVQGYVGVPSDSRAVVKLGLVAAAGVTAGLARRWRWPLFVVAALNLLTLSVWAPAVAASYYAGTTLRRRGHLMVYLLAGLGVWLASVFVARAAGGERAITVGTFPNALFYLLIAMVLPVVVGLWVGARRQVLEGLRERAERLEREQAARADQAAAEERSRIAREMHDVVAHRVSLMVLHAGALEVRAPDDAIAEEARLIRTTGREALANLREVLGVLRSPTGRADAGETDHALAPPPVLLDLDGLLEQSRSAGLPVTRTDEGSPRRLPVIVEQTAYRVVREGLTNVHKHAAGAETEVVLRYLPDRLDVEVRNGPPGRPVDPLPGSGLGLLGLRERIELLGGRLTAGPDGGGFRLHAGLPADPVEEVT